jgi:hypothetical protein
MVSYLPVPSKVGEMKTKPTQHAARILNSNGIQPDLIIARSATPLDEKRKEKISFFCNVPIERVISAPDVNSVYDVPNNFDRDGLSQILCDLLYLSCAKGVTKEAVLWNDFIKKTKKKSKEVHIAWFLIIGSVLMLVSEKLHAQKNSRKDISTLAFPKSIFIGVFQALALFPGISRSGATISAGLFAGLSREAAARYSFLLSIPIVVMAAVFEISKSSIVFGSSSFLPAIVGFAASFVSGTLCIKFLLDFLKKQGLYTFVFYRLLLALILLLVF